MRKSSAVIEELSLVAEVDGQIAGHILFTEVRAGDTVQLALANFSGQYAVDWGSLLAMSVLTMIPVLVIFLLFQKQFMKGMIAGAVKG